MVSLSITPSAPLQHSVGDNITVDFELSDDSVTTPQLYFNLSQPGRQETEILNVIEIEPRKWQANFSLPNDVGLVDAETLSFNYAAIDELNNNAPVITLDNQFQV